MSEKGIVSAMTSEERMLRRKRKETMMTKRPPHRTVPRTLAMERGMKVEDSLMM